MKNNSGQKTEQKGFTIIETLVAITILMISIAGPLTFAQKSLSASIHARYQTQGSFIAQDGMEYMKNYIRNQANFSQVINNLATQCTSAQPCVISTPGTGYWYPTNVSNDYQLRYSVNGIYAPNPSYSPNPDYTNTITYLLLTRRFYVSTSTANVSNPGDEATFVVTVGWVHGTTANSVRVENQIFNIEL